MAIQIGTDTVWPYLGKLRISTSFDLVIPFLGISLEKFTPICSRSLGLVEVLQEADTKTRLDMQGFMRGNAREGKRRGIKGMVGA